MDTRWTALIVTAVLSLVVASVPGTVASGGAGSDPKPHLVRINQEERGQVCAYALDLVGVFVGCQAPEDPTNRTNVSERYCELPLVRCTQVGNAASFNVTRNLTGWRIELSWNATRGTVRSFIVTDAGNVVRYVNQTSPGQGTQQPLVLEDEGPHWQAMLDVFGPGRWGASLFPRTAAAMSWQMSIERECVVPQAPTEALVERACGLTPDATWEELGTWKPPEDPAPPQGDQGLEADMEQAPGNGWSNEPYPGFAPGVGWFHPWPPNEVNRWHVTQGQAHSGDQAWRVGVEDTEAHTILAATQLVSPIVDARGLEEPTLSFWVNGTVGENDVLVPAARPVNSSIFQWKSLDVLWGSTDGWTKKTYRLDGFEGHRLRVGFYFAASHNCLAGTGVDPSLTFGLVSCGHEGSAGYHVDDVVVS